MDNPKKLQVQQLILALDIGTTNVKVCVYEGIHCQLVHHLQEKLTLLISSDGQYVEIDPEQLWTQLIYICRTAISETEKRVGITPGTAKLMIALSCQRNTFLCWDKRTAKPCHRLITWKDNRARHFCEEWNRSYRKMLLNLAGWIAHFFTRSQRFKAARMFRLLAAMVPPRFLVTLEKNPQMNTLLTLGELALGTMDCWLIQRFTGGTAFLTEPSAASSTGMFDPFTGQWGYSILSLLGFPHTILPLLVETTRIGVQVDETILGHQMEIVASLGDSQAAAFGSGCMRKGDLNISLGTGTLFDYVTAGDVHASMCGMYPLVGWKIGDVFTHVLEGRANDTAAALQWANSIGLIPSLGAEDLEQCTVLAEEADPGDGTLCFMPAFSGLQTPLDDDYACAGMLGIRPNTTRGQMLRAVFESISFGVFQIWECLLSELPSARESARRIRCCGGVAYNRFICQQIATLLGQPLELVRQPEFCSARGAALLAGIACGLWDMRQAEELVTIERLFYPQTQTRAELLARYRRWERAQSRCQHYYFAD